MKLPMSFLSVLVVSTFVVGSVEAQPASASRQELNSRLAKSTSTKSVKAPAKRKASTKVAKKSSPKIIEVAPFEEKTMTASADPVAAEEMASLSRISPTVEESTVSSAPLMIENSTEVAQLSQPTFGQSARVSNQPVVTVQDSPLMESKTDSVRRQRQDIEAQTELKIVEKLENDRMRAEQERAQKLMSTLEGTVSSATAAAAAVEPKKEEKKEDSSSDSKAPTIVVVPVIQQQQPAPTPVPVVEQPVAAAPVSTAQVEQVEAKNESNKQKGFVSAIAGAGDYPNARNIRGTYAMGVAGGVIFPSHIVLEGTLLFSSFDIERLDQPYYYGIPEITKMNQMNIIGGVKYQFTDSTVRPNIGGLLSYTRRSYVASQNSYYSSQTETTSNAFDVGISTGVDVMLSESFTLGLDLKYFMNMTYRIQNQAQQSFVYQNWTKLPEDTNYYTLGLMGRFTF